MMDDDEDSNETETSQQFAEIVGASLTGVDGRPLRLKVLDWALCIAMVVGLGLIVGFLLGACAWVWVVVAGKF